MSAGYLQHEINVINPLIRLYKVFYDIKSILLLFWKFIYVGLKFGESSYLV